MNAVVEKTKVSPEVALAANKLLDHIVQIKQLKNDAALARFLDYTPPIISKIRHAQNPVTDGNLIRIFEKTLIPMEQLLALRKGDEDGEG